MDLGGDNNFILFTQSKEVSYLKENTMTEQRNDDSVNIEVNNSQAQSKQNLSPAKSSPKKGRQVSPAERVKHALQHQQSFDIRQTKLKDDSNVDDAYIEEYNKTEIIRSSIKEVKKRAQEEKERRESPDRTYGGIKSAVAKNMKVIKGSKKGVKKDDAKPNWQQGLTTPNKTSNATRVPKWDKTEVARSGLKSNVEQMGADVEIMKQGGRV